MRSAATNFCRRGATLIEVLVSVLIGAVLFVTFLELHQKGLRTMESDHRKVSALRRTHIEIERLRHVFASSQFSWIAPIENGQLVSRPPSWLTSALAAASTPGVASPPLSGTSPLALFGRPTAGRPGEHPPLLEVFFDPAERTLQIGNQKSGGDVADARFMYGSTVHVSKFSVSADEHKNNIPTNATRERSTLLSASYCQPQDETLRFAAHVFESQHRWCVLSDAIHSGYTDDPDP